MDDHAPEHVPEMQRAAAVCYRFKASSTAGVPGMLEFLLIRSHEGGWIFPKGGILPGETAWQAAQREAFEEAGVSGEIRHEPLTNFLYFKEVVNLEYHVTAFLLQVKSVQPTQELERFPIWLSAGEANRLLGLNRPSRYAEEIRRVIQLAAERLREESRG